MSPSLSPASKKWSLRNSQDKQGFQSECGRKQHKGLADCDDKTQTQKVDGAAAHSHMESMGGREHPMRLLRSSGKNVKKPVRYELAFWK